MADTAKQQSDRLLKKGAIGSLVAAVCCFTPVLVVLFAGAGLSGLIGGIDYVVFPAMFASLGLVALALYMRAGSPGRSPKMIIAALVVAFSAALFWLEFRYAIRISLLAVGLVGIYWLFLRAAIARTA